MVNGYCILLFENDAMVVNKLSVLHDFEPPLNII